MGAGVIVTCAEPDFAASSTEVAVTVTVAGNGTLAGAVYTPSVEIVPSAELPPETPFTCHVTELFCAFVTTAWNARVFETSTLAVLGVAVTLIGAHAPALDTVALVGVTITFVESCRPTSSVTVSCTVIEPEMGATTEVDALSGLDGVPAPHKTLQRYVAIVWLLAAALAPPFKDTGWPATTVTGVVTFTIGRSAAVTAPSEFAMPAPHVLVVQLHSAV
jgi:hypothetical protein